MKILGITLILIGLTLIFIGVRDLSDVIRTIKYTVECQSATKDRTDSTPNRFVSKFTGQYLIANGVLYCMDEKNVMHKINN